MACAEPFFPPQRLIDSFSAESVATLPVTLALRRARTFFIYNENWPGSARPIVRNVRKRLNMSTRDGSRQQKFTKNSPIHG